MGKSAFDEIDPEGGSTPYPKQKKDGFFKRTFTKAKANVKAKVREKIAFEKEKSQVRKEAFKSESLRQAKIQGKRRAQGSNAPRFPNLTANIPQSGGMLGTMGGNQDTGGLNVGYGVGLGMNNKKKKPRRMDYF